MKKNLIVILLFPFLIAILGVVTITRTYNLVDADIVAIEWDYSDVEGFKLVEGGTYALHARGVNQRGQQAANNTLIWEVHNKDLTESPYAEIVYLRDTPMLKTLAVGEVTITCHNENGNIFKSMTGVIYEKGAVLVSSSIKASGNNIDPNIYYGDIDLNNGEEQAARFNLTIKTLPDGMLEHLKVYEKTDNFEFDIEKQQISIIKGIGDSDASIRLGFDDSELGTIDTTFQFKIIGDGINIYTYDDLLYVSNNAKIGVLRKSFESVDNAFVLDENDEVKLENGSPVTKDNNITCFGRFNTVTKEVKFTKQDLYHFKTTYNSEFIDYWNSRSTNIIDDQIYVGLRLQNDFYGNGYTINFHNLTYPTGGSEVELEDGSTLFIPGLAKDDIFRGPLPFYTLGDHNNMPLVEALGQDNVGLYLDGNGITLNDVYVKNCDYGSFYDVLDTVGSVVEVHGNNVTIKNCRLSNGKNVVRSFSNMNLKIENSLLSYAKCFLIYTGCNEYKKNNSSQAHPFVNEAGQDIRSTLQDYLAKDAPGDKVLTSFMMGTFTDKNMIRRGLDLINDALNNGDNAPTDIKATMEVVDTYFYYASVSAIGNDVLFNGPFLYSAIPSVISELLGMLPTESGASLAEMLATNVGGLSYPSKVSLKGNCKFFNYQTIDKNHTTVDGLDISGLINENITAMVATLGEQYAVDINIDKIFPIKDFLYDAAGRNNEIAVVEDKRYINVISAWYGGGINNSTVDLSGLNDEVRLKIGNPRLIDITENYINLPKASGQMAMYKNMVLRAVTVVTGTYPFKFVCVKDGYLYGEKPNVVDLIINARGA